MIALAVCAICLSGAGLVAVGLPQGSRALKTAVGVALGFGTWSAAYAAQWIASGSRGTGWKDVALCLCGLALLVIARKRKRSGAPEDDAMAGKRARAAQAHPPGAAVAFEERWLAPLFVLACVVCAAAFIEHTWRLPDGGWDAWMTWNLRARFLVRAANARDAFSPDMLYWAHQEYPWLLPGVVAQTFLLFGESYAAPAAVAFAFGALLVAAVVTSLAQLEGRKLALVAGLVLCTTPCFPTFAANQQSDIPLALFFFTAAALLEIGRGRFRTLLLAGFAAGLCVWTKNEGTIFIGCVAFGLFVFRKEALLPFALGAVPGFALLFAFKLLVAPPSPLTEPGLLGRLVDPRRWLVLATDVARRLVYFQAFGLWLLAWLAALVVTRNELRRSPLALALLLSYAACAGIYLGVPYPLHWIFKSSADRLFMQLWPAAVLLTLPALRRATART